MLTEPEPARVAGTWMVGLGVPGCSVPGPSSPSLAAMVSVPCSRSEGVVAGRVRLDVGDPVQLAAADRGTPELDVGVRRDLTGDAHRAGAGTGGRNLDGGLGRAGLLGAGTLVAVVGRDGQRALLQIGRSSCRPRSP